MRTETPYQASLEITNKKCGLFRLMTKHNVREIRIIDTRLVKKGVTRHLVSITQYPDGKKTDEHQIFANSYGKRRAYKYFCFDCHECQVCNVLLQHGAFLLSGKNIGKDTMMYFFISPHFGVYQQITSKLEEIGFKVRIRDAGIYNPQSKLLTNKQQIALWFALKMGFFRYPKKSNILEISSQLEISPSTFAETTRRGINRLVENYFMEQRYR